MTVAELIAHLQQFNPNAVVVQSGRAGTYSSTDLVEAGLFDRDDHDATGTFWVPADGSDEGPWFPEPGVDVHAVCLWAKSWPRGEDDETGA